MQEICDRISRVYSGGLEESVQSFLESLGKLKRAYLTQLEEKVLSLIEKKYRIIDEIPHNSQSTKN
ncbi:hypothetical protein NIES2107_11360 [Nostoc carneum NIES-2107]|nr:hypothetical protein NIES2107_11360 [Nostoc carneum NIES-2107]